MSARINEDEVLAIIAVDSDITDLDPFIDGAHIIVEAILGTSGLAEATLKEIERWIAAHLLAVSRQPPAGQNTTGSAQVSFRSPKLGEFLCGTAYGQQALILDSTGLLASTGSGRVAFKFKAYGVVTE